MFARLEFVLAQEKSEEFVEKVRSEILPILQNQKGFLGLLPLLPQAATSFGRREQVITVSLWANSRDAEQYEREVFPVVQAILGPYVMPVAIKAYTVDPALAEHFQKARAA
jgi:heme-degrading monooxygenase HmoA